MIVQKSRLCISSDGEYSTILIFVHLFTFFLGGGEEWSATPCASNSSLALNFSDYSTLVHYPDNWDDRHLLAQLHGSKKQYTREADARTEICSTLSELTATVSAEEQNRRRKSFFPGGFCISSFVRNFFARKKS
jgi:hypothetical protein